MVGEVLYVVVGGFIDVVIDIVKGLRVGLVE